MSAAAVRAHLRNGDFVLARVAAMNALDSGDTASRAELLGLFARVCARLGEPAHALTAAQQAADVDGHWEVALSLGEAWLAQGQPMRARAVLADALARSRDASGEGPADSEIWLGTTLAEAFRAAGDPEGGLGAASRARAFAERAYGGTSLEIAETLYVMGMCEHASGRSDRARSTLSRALALRRAHDPTHPDVATTLDVLGNVARGLQKPVEAVRLHREALAIWSQRLGAEAAPIGACRQGLAQALHRTGDFAGARIEMAEAFRITRQAFGPDHVDTWIARFELGRFELDCGLVEEGLHAMTQAHGRVAESLGAEHPVVRAMRRWL